MQEGWKEKGKNDEFFGGKNDDTAKSKSKLKY